MAGSASQGSIPTPLRALLNMHATRQGAGTETREGIMGAKAVAAPMASST